MTVREMILKNPFRAGAPSDRYFTAINPRKNEELLFCFDSFQWPEQWIRMLDLEPDLLDWNVTQEHLDQAEPDEYARKRKPTDVAAAG